MFNAIKTTVLGRFFLAAVMVLLPGSAYAQCSKTWDATGEWEIRQGPGWRTVIRLNLKQSGIALSGTASRDGGIGTKAVTGEASGDADGDAFALAIQWPGSDEYRVYRAKVPATGKLEGETYVGADKRDRDTWYSNQPLTCGWSPGKSRGNFISTRLSANAPVQTGQAAGSLLKGPSLVASQAAFPTPYMNTGFVILTWDAGPDHPTADVWVKYGRERVLFMKQPKGGQQVPVQRGQQYTYVLMDGRTVLATATFVAH